MFKKMFDRIAAKRLSKIAQRGRQMQRNKMLHTARQIRKELNLNPLTILEDK